MELDLVTNIKQSIYPNPAVYTLYTDLRVCAPPTTCLGPLKTAVIEGPQTVTYYRVSADSGLNIQEPTWNINFPTNQILNRFPKLRYYVQINFTAALPVGQTILQLGTNDGFGAFPINSTINQYQLILNGITITTCPAEYWLSELHYMSDEVRRGALFDGSSATPDQFQNYNDRLTYGNQRNVFGLYGTSSNSKFKPRGQLEIKVLTNTNTTATIQCMLTESILCPPFSNNAACLRGLQTMQLKILTDTGALPRMWRHDAILGSPILTGPTVTFYRAPELIYAMLVPSSPFRDPVRAEIPYTYSYTTITPIARTYYPLLAAYNAASPLDSSTGTIVFDSIQVNTVPYYFYIWVKENRTQQNYTTSDSYCRINYIQVQIGNDGPLLFNANNYDLYMICKRNALNMSYEQFSQQIGSVICLQNGIDIPFPAVDLSSGVETSLQYTFTINFTNINTGRALNVEAWVIYHSGGSITFQNNAGLINLKEINRQMVLTVKEEKLGVMQAVWKQFLQQRIEVLGGSYLGPNIEVLYDENSMLQGGAISDYFKNVGSKIKTGAVKVKDVIKKGVIKTGQTIKKGADATWRGVKKGVEKVKEFFIGKPPKPTRIDREANILQDWKQELKNNPSPPQINVPSAQSVSYEPLDQKVSQSALLLDRVHTSIADQKIIDAAASSAVPVGALESKLTPAGFQELKQSAEITARINDMSPIEIKNRGGLGKIIHDNRPYQTSVTDFKEIENIVNRGIQGTTQFLREAVPIPILAPIAQHTVNTIGSKIVAPFVKGVSKVVGAVLTGRNPLDLEDKLEWQVPQSHHTSELLNRPVHLPTDETEMAKYIKEKYQNMHPAVPTATPHNPITSTTFSSTLGPGYTSSSMSSSLAPTTVSHIVNPAPTISGPAAPTLPPQSSIVIPPSTTIVTSGMRPSRQNIMTKPRDTAAYASTPPRQTAAVPRTGLSSDVFADVEEYTGSVPGGSRNPRGRRRLTYFKQNLRNQGKRTAAGGARNNGYFPPGAIDFVAGRRERERERGGWIDPRIRYGYVGAGGRGGGKMWKNFLSYFTS